MHMNQPQDQHAGGPERRPAKHRIDPALARRNRRTAGFLILLAVAFLLAFLNNFGVFK